MELFRVLQGQGFSRRNIMQSIKDRTIFVDEKIVDEFDYEVFGGENVTGIIKYQPISLIIPQDEQKIITILFYKPVGYVTSVADPDRPTIYQILPQKYHHLRYAGRLDRDSEGLLVLSNDRQLINHLTHPRFDHDKIYLVKLDKVIIDQDILKLKQGLMVDNWGNIRESEAADLLKCKNVKLKENNVVEITLDYGKKRHIRRLFKALGYLVQSLKRIQQGEYELGNLQPGQLVEISLI